MDSTWGDISRLVYGRSLRSYSRDPERGVEVFGTNGPIGFTNVAQAEGPKVIIGRKGAYRGVHLATGAFWVIDTAYYLELNPSIDPFWAYYSLKNSDIDGLASGSAVPSTTREDFYSLPVEVPSSGEQRAIAELLGALDTKLAANASLVRAADELAHVIIDEALQSGFSERSLGDVAEFRNRLRVPLSARQRRDRPGSVPYYGAAGRMGWVDEALFDEDLILVGEDGSVMRPNGLPVVQHVWGPSWVNNHAHVLVGRRIENALLRRLVERSSVAHLVTGAVQPKISMGNLKSLVIAVPTNATDVTARLTGLDALRKSVTAESGAVTRTRDALLPLLMSGKLRIKDAERTVEEVL